MHTVTCIIPCYNEESRIGEVLKAVSNHPLVKEVLVVDDGSTDNTKRVVEQFSEVTFIQHATNKGKSAAMATGLRKATGTYVLFLDADLVGLTAQNITDLITPVIENKADMSMSLRKNSPGLWRQIGIDYISGERVLPRALFDMYIDTMEKLPHFGIEVFINKLIIDKHFRIKIVWWPEVESPFKLNKYGLIKGVLGDISMMKDIFCTISVYAIIRQIILLRKRRV